MEQIAPQWATLLGFAAPLFIAGASGVWAVWIRMQENQRAEWKRMEELIEIIYNGHTKGIWAQKIAVDELTSLSGRRHNIRLVLRDAEQYFRNGSASGVALADHISAALERHS